MLIGPLAYPPPPTSFFFGGGVSGCVCVCVGGGGLGGGRGGGGSEGRLLFRNLSKGMYGGSTIYIARGRDPRRHGEKKGGWSGSTGIPE